MEATAATLECEVHDGEGEPRAGRAAVAAAEEVVADLLHFLVGNARPLVFYGNDDSSATVSEPAPVDGASRDFVARTRPVAPRTAPA